VSAPTPSERLTDRASELLFHYLRLAGKGVDMEADLDYRAEIAAIVDFVVEAAVARIKETL
jgi:hypothetical protein